MAAETSEKQALLSASFSVRYAGKSPVLRDVKLEIQRGGVMGLVGQRGSRKSTLAMAILGLLDRKRAQAEGTIRFQDTEFLQLPESKPPALRGRAAAWGLQG